MRSSIIIGAGPGGMGPLVYAARTGVLDDWLDQGVALVERGSRIGGTIGRYHLNSDSPGYSYLECFDTDAARAKLGDALSDRLTQEMEAQRMTLPPLELVGRFVDRLGRSLEDSIARHSASAFLPHASATAVRLQSDGTVRVDLQDSSGGRASLEAVTAVLATGGCQDLHACLATELLPGRSLAELGGERALADGRLMLSDRLLTAAGQREVEALLAMRRDARVVILGGAHSAFSAAWVLLQRFPSGTPQLDGITILRRRPPRVFYAARAEAEADGYPVTDADICPATLRVNRLGGLRGDGRELWRRLAGAPGTAPEPRLELRAIADFEARAIELEATLSEAALIVPAMGYRSTTVPIFDPDGRKLEMSPGHPSATVDSYCRLLCADGTALPSVLGIGLGSGFKPWGRMGGEPAFDGQQNSLWLYQHELGEIIYRSVSQRVGDRQSATVGSPAAVSPIAAAPSRPPPMCDLGMVAAPA